MINDVKNNDSNMPIQHSVQIILILLLFCMRVHLCWHLRRFLDKTSRCLIAIRHVEHKINLIFMINFTF